ncbi:MAG: hypothetical protein GYA58_01815 [Anaerolineaceae bacterium]|jgi:hypothetical protein|nr:hypothetical protein [Anaerolineaceae bacterium]
MSIHVFFNEEDQIIESHLDEPFDWSIIERMVPQLSRQILERQCRRILLDFRGANLHLSTFNVYATPQKLAEEFKKRGIDIRSLKRALIFMPDDGDYRFLETVSINQAQTLRVFYDEEPAKIWLTNKNNAEKS